MSNNKNTNPIVFTILGFVLIIISSFFLYRAFLFQKTAVTTEGVVTEYTALHRKAKLYYLPTVEFKDMNNNSYHFQGSGTGRVGNWEAPDTGSRVTVYYDPTNPIHATLKWDNLIPSLVGLFLGLTFAITGFVIGLKKYRRSTPVSN